METLRRRRVLRAAGGLLAVGLAGCSSDGSTDQQTGTPESETATTSAPDPEPSALTLSASVRRQPSANAPARVALTLANGGDAPIELGIGPALYAGETRRVVDVALDAVDAGADLDATYTNGCWTVPAEYGSPIRDPEFRRLAAGDERTERYDVYTVAGVDACLPEGTYALSKEVAVRGAADVTVAFRFAIDEDGGLSVTDDGTTVRVD